jgi:F-type H+-transporting ATPase subunit b
MGDIAIFGIPVSLGTMIYQAVLFTVLIFILKRKLLGKVVNALESRRNSIESQLKLAESLKTEAENLLIRQRETSEMANLEAREIIAKAREEASSILKTARKEAFMIRTEAYAERSAMKGRDAS